MAKTNKFAATFELQKKIPRKTANKVRNLQVRIVGDEFQQKLVVSGIVRVVNDKYEVEKAWRDICPSDMQLACNISCERVE